MSLQFKGRETNLLAVIGLILSFTGSFFLAFDANPTVHAITDRLIGFDQVETGWKTLANFRYKTEAGESYSLLSQNELGFQQIVRVIENQPGYTKKNILAIGSIAPMALSVGSGSVPNNIIFLETAETGIQGIARQETVREWLNSSRRLDLLSDVSLFLFLVLLRHFI